MMLKEVYCKGCKKHGPIELDEHSHKDCQCNGQYWFNTYGWRENLPYPEERIIAENRVNERGFQLCKWCGLPCLPNQLITCTVCGAKFPGPRPYFPIDYECEKCE